MSHGELQKSETGLIYGEIRTRDICEKISLQENKHRESPKAPSHIILARAPKGHMYQAGVAWPYQNKQGGTGYQLKLDDPSFGEKPIMFWASPVAGGWDVSLAREDDKQQAA